MKIYTHSWSGIVHELNYIYLNLIRLYSIQMVWDMALRFQAENVKFNSTLNVNVKRSERNNGFCCEILLITYRANVQQRQ